MAPSYRQRDVEFRVEGERRLCRVVRGTKKGEVREYEHFCDLDILLAVIYYIIDMKRRGITTGEMWEFYPDHPRTQMSVALDFLKDRGVVDVKRRRVFPASDYAFEDAMIEFYWLVHKAKKCGT